MANAHDSGVAPTRIPVDRSPEMQPQSVDTSADLQGASARHALCGNCMTPHICAEDGPGCAPAAGVPVVQAPSGEAEYLSWFPVPPLCSICDEPGGRYRWVMSREHAACDRCFIAWYEGAGTDRESIRKSLGIDGVAGTLNDQPGDSK